MSQTLSELDLVQNRQSKMSNMNKDISPSSVVVCADETLSCDLQGEAVVLNLQSGTYFGLNPLGARIWKLIQKPARVSSVLEELLKEYEVDATQCEEDLLSFLKLLQARELITVQDTRDN